MRKPWAPLKRPGRAPPATGHRRLVSVRGRMRTGAPPAPPAGAPARSPRGSSIASPSGGALRRAGGAARVQMAHLAQAEWRRGSPPIAGARGRRPPSPPAAAARALSRRSTGSRRRAQEGDLFGGAARAPRAGSTPLFAENAGLVSLGTLEPAHAPAPAAPRRPRSPAARPSAFRLGAKSRNPSKKSKVS